MPDGGPLERRGHPQQRDLVVGATDELQGQARPGEPAHHGERLMPSQVVMAMATRLGLAGPMRC